MSKNESIRIWHRRLKSQWHSVLRLLNKLLGHRISDRHFYNWIRTKDDAELDHYLKLTERSSDE